MQKKKTRFIGILSAIAILVLCVLAAFVVYGLRQDYQNLFALEDVPPSVLEALQADTLRLLGLIACGGVLGAILVAVNFRNSREIETAAQELLRVNSTLENRMAAMEQSLDGLFIVDKGGILRYMTKQLMKMLLIKADDVQAYLNQDWVRLFDKEMQTSILAEAITALEYNQSWSGEYLFDHEHYPKTIELVLARLPDGGFVGNSRDITERKQEEGERQELQSQFYQAQKMEAIGRLAGGVAHDFNNILAAINGYTEFLIEDLNDRPEEQKFADKIMSATQQARQLVDQILTFSRRNDTRTEKVDLLATLHENISMIKASAIATIEIHENIELESAYVHGNATQISQAIMNLCVNALDAMDAKHGVLRVEVKRANQFYLEKKEMVVDEFVGDGSMPIVRVEEGAQDGQAFLMMGYIAKDKPYVCISVADTGSGIKKEVMEKVFEPCFTTKAVNKGTGLGLSTVQGVVAQHQGAMVIESIVGLGTRFNLYFPLEESEKPQEAERDTQDLSKFEFEGARILLVEDQNTVREMTEKMLKRVGFYVISAPNGQKALELLKQSQGQAPFDLVLTDHAMPHMTGFELIQACASLFPDLPFVIASGYSKEKLQESVDQFPAIKAVLRKPVTRRELKEQIYKALSEMRFDPLTETLVKRARHDS